MVESSFLYNACFGWLPMLLASLIGFGLCWLFFRGKKQDGDLSIEGEGALRAEADGLRTRVRDLEGRVSTRDGEVSDLKTKLAAAAAGAAAATAAVKGGATLAAPKAEATDDDETYALEWRNRYLAARVKYLEGRLSESPAPKAKAKKVATKTKAAPKAALAPVSKKKAVAKPKVKAAPKPKAVKAPKPKVLYTDGPTDGTPDDLKLIKGVGPKFEKDLNSKGIYYFRQIGNWKAADVTMVEGVIDSIPGRIKRDEWVKQAKVLAKTGGAKASKDKKKPGPKPGTKASALTADGRKRAKPGPKAKAPKAVLSDMDKYYANVVKHDKGASRDVVESIVKYCGISLKSRDSSLVACSDKTEVETVVNGFVAKKLGITDGGQALVQGVCEDMKSERFKSRVTFYYLCAKKAGKLSVFN